MKAEDLKKLKIPDKPGVYFFLKGGLIRRGGEVLYIGKATSLKDRVKSYFLKELIGTRGPVILDMAFKADNIKWQETDSVLEALILEASLIKKYQPKYNTKEKSDKSFNYVCITKEELPKILIVRGRELKDFATQKFSGAQKGFSERRRKFLRGKVFGPYPNNSQLKEALKIIRKIFPFLDDKSKNYAEFYRQIGLIPDLNDRKMYLQNIKNIKLFFEGKKKKIFLNLKKEMNEYAREREFEKAGEIKRQLFSLQHINDVALIKKEKNLRVYALRHSHSVLGGQGSSAHSEDSYEYIPADFQTLFRIEAYDIAHMSGKSMVGVMTVLEDGEVARNEYKKFRIRTQAGANDTGALREVLERRLAHREWAYPDIVVVDGGVAQVNIVKVVFKKISLNIPIVSVLKDDRHKAKDILGDKKIALKYEREILLANSEAHRLAVSYHKKLRSKNFLK